MRRRLLRAAAVLVEPLHSRQSVTSGTASPARRAPVGGRGISSRERVESRGKASKRRLDVSEFAPVGAVGGLQRGKPLLDRRNLSPRRHSRRRSRCGSRRWTSHRCGRPRSRDFGGHDLADEFDGDFRDRIDHAGERLQPEQTSPCSRACAVLGLDAIIEDDFASLAGDQFEQLHLVSVLRVSFGDCRAPAGADPCFPVDSVCGAAPQSAEFASKMMRAPRSR